MTLWACVSRSDGERSSVTVAEFTSSRPCLSRFHPSFTPSAATLASCSVCCAACWTCAAAFWDSSLAFWVASATFSRVCWSCSLWLWALERELHPDNPKTSAIRDPIRKKTNSEPLPYRFTITSEDTKVDFEKIDFGRASFLRLRPRPRVLIPSLRFRFVVNRPGARRYRIVLAFENREDRIETQLGESPAYSRRRTEERDSPAVLLDLVVSGR